MLQDEDQTVGQGSRSNVSSVEVTSGNSTATSRTVGTGVAGELQIGPLVGGSSYSASTTHAYSIETEESTVFEGEVGDIESEADYDNWYYAYGVTLHQHRGDSTDKRGFQILHFYTIPLGLNY